MNICARVLDCNAKVTFRIYSWTVRAHMNNKPTKQHDTTPFLKKVYCLHSLHVHLFCCFGGRSVQIVLF